MFARHYFGLSDKEIKEILEYLGHDSLESFYKSKIPNYYELDNFNLPLSLSEEEAREYIEKLGNLNSSFKVFAGGGAYDCFIPSAINQLLLRSEFYTAYTPYQPEVSQGTLQVMFEFQSLICELTKMEVSNASVYDGASALAEAVLMSFRIKEKYKVIIPKNLNPNYKEVLKTYLQNIDSKIVEVGFDKTGRINLDELRDKIDNETASVVIQNPNYFGIIEEVFEIREITRLKNALLISVFDPVSLAILAPPGEYDADIAIGEGQALGIPLSFGGPYVGLFTSKKQYIRQMPGRIVGITEDGRGKRGFVTVLQTREQHIRRAKATSNICTNQQLIATAVCIYLTLMGSEGLKRVALMSLYKAEYLKEKIKHKLVFNSPTFREFVIRTNKKAEDVILECAKEGFLLGPKVSILGENYLLVAITEKRKKEEIDKLAEILYNI
ncbi:MAG: aminomethyl-transferring glycine dehydrogenase subunit GcvPA [candidate division WOR-3 bacterium]|nr:aminomethyl-transferring glycine dehydrogenase subunit GcvPA [candidate division WOR-3 bacterium]